MQWSESCVTLKSLECFPWCLHVHFGRCNCNCTSRCARTSEWRLSWPQRKQNFRHGCVYFLCVWSMTNKLICSFTCCHRNPFEFAHLRRRVIFSAGNNIAFKCHLPKATSHVLYSFLPQMVFKPAAFSCPLYVRLLFHRTSRWILDVVFLRAMIPLPHMINLGSPALEAHRATICILACQTSVVEND